MKNLRIRLFFERALAGLIITLSCTGLRADVLAGGASHSLVLCGDGTVWAVGSNQYGMLGDGTTTSSTIPVQVVGLSNATAVGAGFVHSLALHNNGTVSAWGFNSAGQLGNGTTTTSLTPVSVLGLSNVTGVDGGNSDSVAVDSSGAMWAWGHNQSGHWGNGTFTDSTTPVQAAPTLSNALDISSTGSHSLFLLGNGTLWSAGANGEGQLGDGTTTQSATPVQVVGLSNVNAIDALGDNLHNLALQSNGTVWAWGLNNLGQLGNGTTTNSSIPVQVPGLSNIIEVASNSRASPYTDSFSMALQSNGTVWTWGANNYGQLGNGTFVNSTTPVQVTGLSNVIAIGTGRGHALALRNDGTVWAWGLNNLGQLGNGTTTNSATPVKMLVTCSPQGCPGGAPPADTCDVAIPVDCSPLHREGLTVGTPGEHHWRSFTLSQPNLVRIETLTDTPGTGNDDTDLSLWGGCVGGTPDPFLAFNDDSPLANDVFMSRIEVHLAAGTYYVETGGSQDIATPDDFCLEIECLPSVSVAGSTYSVTGSSTGDGFSWGIDNDGIYNPFGGTFNDLEDCNPSGPAIAVGSAEAALAAAFANDIGSHVVPCPSSSALPIPPFSATLGPPGSFTITGPMSSTIRLFVGLEGQPPTCLVTPVGCAYNPTITKVDCGEDCPVAVIPTVSEWGRIIMALLLITAAAIAIRRRAVQVGNSVGVATMSRSDQVLFAPSLFLKTLLMTVALVTLGLAITRLAFGSLPLRDVIGTLLCVPVVAYLVHLWRYYGASSG